MIGENLESLLGRANAAARPASTLGTPQAASTKKGPKIIEVTPEPETDAMASLPTAGSGHGTVGGDGRIESMLADFEAAAQKARQPRRNGGGNAPAKDSPQGYEPAGLPEIPVFRKAKIEVFKRDKNGALVKAREA
mgnify:FL=1